jgi:hypothetical protein
VCEQPLAFRTHLIFHEIRGKNGDAGVDAVIDELRQLYGKKVGKSVQPNEISAEGNGKHCRISNKNVPERLRPWLRRWTETTCMFCEGESTSPNVSVEALLLTCAIDAKEGRDVAAVDVPGAVMQADMDDEIIHVRLQGRMAEHMTEFDTVYQKYIGKERDQSILYIRLLKALCGTLRAAHLFSNMISGQLVGWGFEIMQYDGCVANKTINGKQRTVRRHIDGLKISHNDKRVATKLIEELKSVFGKEAPLTVTRGKDT